MTRHNECGMWIGGVLAAVFFLSLVLAAFLWARHLLEETHRDTLPRVDDVRCLECEED